jgi:hypothetical protein
MSGAPPRAVMSELDDIPAQRACRALVMPL